MDSETFKNRVKRLKEVNTEIAKLDPAIRAEALALLSEYISAGETPKHPHTGGAAHARGQKAQHDVSDDVESFFAKHPVTGKPAENAVLIATYLYSQYGSKPFQLDDIRNMADTCGVTIPASLDMTLKQAQRDGKTLFKHAGRNQYQPTVHGEIYFKQKYGVKKGTKPRPDESAA